MLVPTGLALAPRPGRRPPPAPGHRPASSSSSRSSRSSRRDRGPRARCSVAVATAVLVLGLLNAVNLLDGQDGLAAGVGVVIAGGFALPRRCRRPRSALGLAGALAGFLVFNRPPARIYLGDAGAYFVGHHGRAAPGADPATPGPRGPSGGRCRCSSAVPVGRHGDRDPAPAAARHRPLLQGDRSHVYDQLVDRGMSIGQLDARGHRRAGRAHRHRPRRDPGTARRRAGDHRSVHRARVVAHRRVTRRGAARRTASDATLDPDRRADDARRRGPRAEIDRPGRTRFERPSSHRAATPTGSAGIHSSERGPAVVLEPGDPRAVPDERARARRRTTSTNAPSRRSTRDNDTIRPFASSRPTGSTRNSPSAAAAPTIEPGPAVALDTPRPT